MRFNDAILGVIIVAFGVFVIAMASTFSGLPGQDFGPAFFPTVVGGIMLACGVILITKGYAVRKEVGWVEFGEWAKSPRHIINLILVPVAMIVYIVASDFIGFVPISFVVLFVLLARFGVSVVASIVLSAATTLIIHTVFYKFLLVPLPWGLLEPLAW